MILFPTAKVKFYAAQGPLDTPTNGQKTFLKWAGDRGKSGLTWAADNKTWTVGNVTGKITGIAPLDKPVNNSQKAYVVTIESKGVNLPPLPKGVGKITGTIWLDDNDGQINPGEAAVAGVSVYLFDANSDVVASAVSANDGSYEFDDLPEGTYWLTADLPPADAFSARYTGNDPYAVNAISAATGVSDPLVVTSSASEVDASIGLVDIGGVDGTEDPSPMVDPGGADP